MTGRRILIVDDEPLIRWSLAERLRAESYQVVEAGTGGHAIEHFGGGVDLVLLDYNLPDMDGLTILRRINALKPDVPVIMLSALASVETAGEAITLGAFHFAHKPFDLDEIALVVARALDTTASTGIRSGIESTSTRSPDR
jgi:two-component system response regulator AtoC